MINELLPVEGQTEVDNCGQVDERKQTLQKYQYSFNKLVRNQNGRFFNNRNSAMDVAAR